MAGDFRGYRAYLIRLWQTCSSEQIVWRASAEDAHSGKRWAFPNLAALYTFLEESTVLSGEETERVF